MVVCILKNKSAIFLRINSSNYYFSWNFQRKLAASTTKLKQVKDDSKSTSTDGKQKKEIPVLYQVRATNRFFYGPLLETISNNSKLVTNAKNSNASKAKKQPRRSKVIDGAYEQFAQPYSRSNNGYTTIFSENINKNIQTKGETDSAKKFIYYKSPKTYNKIVNCSEDEIDDAIQKLKNITIPATVKNDSHSVVCLGKSKYLDIPESVNLDTVRKYPLFRAFTSENKSSAIDQSDNNKEVLSLAYNGSDEKSLPSVSKILNDTMSEASKATLLKWEAKMIAKLGEQGFKDYKKELFAQGSLLHSCIQHQLQDDTDPTAEQLTRLGGHWNSVEETVRQIRGDGAVMALESRVTHPHLHYAGIVDCIAYYRGTPVLIEWKTSSQPKPNLKFAYDNPLQLAAYIGAIQYDPNYKDLFKVQSGLITYSYVSGNKAHAHLLTPTLLQQYWTAWLGRLALFWQINAKTLVQ